MDRGTITFPRWGVMLLWTQPRSPGLFIFPCLCHRITLQSNDLNSVVVSAARLLRAPSIGSVRYLSLRAGGSVGGCTGWKFLTADFAGARHVVNFTRKTLYKPEVQLSCAGSC